MGHARIGAWCDVNVAHRILQAGHVAGTWFGQECQVERALPEGQLAVKRGFKRGPASTTIDQDRHAGGQP
jgi:hypothetical protein